MKKYIVIWTEEDILDTYPPQKLTDHFKVFVDEDTEEENLKLAQAHYDLLIQDTSTHSASICVIIQSTDY